MAKRLVDVDDGLLERAREALGVIAGVTGQPMEWIVPKGSVP